MKAPAFWGQSGRGGALATLLKPLSCLYVFAGVLREKITQPHKLEIPVICIGNLVAGGTGKTPVAISLGEYLKSQDIKLHYLSRGYGGNLQGPIKVDPAIHKVADVGDEPLLLADIAPTWVSKDRAAGAKAAQLDGADVIIMDDGFQNPHLYKDLSFIVIDAAVGFGNGSIMPAGPLREPIAKGLGRADACILMGNGVAPAEIGNIPTYRGHLKAVDESLFEEEAYVAFAGIGRPEKFFESLNKAGLNVVAQHEFGDHHLYCQNDLVFLQNEAAKYSAKLITTEKDLTRLSSDQRKYIAAFPVVLYWDEGKAPYELIMKALG